MKNLVIILSGLLFLSSCEMGKSRAAVSEEKENTVAEASASDFPSDDFEATVVRVLKAFQQRDSEAINQLIHKDKGLVVMFNPGAFRVYETIDEIDFESSQPVFLETTFVTDYKLRYEALPEYDCDGGWPKFGLFCDTLKHDNRLSFNLKLLVDAGYFTEEWDWNAEIAKFEEMEKNSRMVVLASKTSDNPDMYNDNLIFSLTMIDGKWYLTLLDMVTPCSA